MCYLDYEKSATILFSDSDKKPVNSAQSCVVSNVLGYFDDIFDVL